MPFRTKLDLSNNRQAKQRERTESLWSGSTTFGLPFSALTSGPDTESTEVTETLTGVTSTFSGNSGTTIWVFGDSRMELAESTLSAVTPSNSGTTQFTDDVFTAVTSTVIDGNNIDLTFSGVAFNIQITSMSDLGGGSYSGSAITNQLGTEEFNGLEILSATSLDYTGRTIWVDVPEILRTNKLIVSDGAVAGYVLKSDSEGMATWQPDASGSTGPWSAGTGTNSANLDGSDNTVSGDYSAGIGTGNTISGKNSMAIGRSNIVIGDNSLAIGKLNTINSASGGLPSFDADGPWGMALGINCTVSAAAAFAGGYASIASDAGAFAWGDTTTASGQDSFAVNDRTIASGFRAFSTGRQTTASGSDTSSFGNNTTASAARAQASGYQTLASGTTSNANGSFTVAGGDFSTTWGSFNYAYAESSNISNGESNRISYYGHFSSIGGGYGNQMINQGISYLGVGGPANFIGAGKDNLMSGDVSWSVIGGGRTNQITGQTQDGFIGGGSYNYILATTTTTQPFIGGGGGNIIHTSNQAVIGGGSGNEIYSSRSFIGGGRLNKIFTFSNYSVIAGGSSGRIYGGVANFIGGGRDNRIYSNTDYSSIIGGNQNRLLSGLTNVHIIGSNITGTTANTTYVNSLHVDGRLSLELENEIVVTTATTISLSGGNVFNIDLTGSTELDYINEDIGYYDFLITNQTTGSTLTFATGRWMAESGITPTITSTSGATDMLLCIYNGNRMVIKQVINDIQDI